MSWLPKGDRLPPCARFHIANGRFVHDNINSKEVCRVFILRRQSASNLMCLVLVHRVTCHMQFIRSFIHSYVHAFMHLHINTFIYLHTQACTMRIYTHVSIHTWLHRPPRVLSARISSIQSSIVRSGKSQIEDSLRFICLSSKWQVLHNGQLEIYFRLSSKWQVLHNGQLEIYFRLSSKWQVLHNGQLEVYFSFFQVASPT